MTWLVTTDLHLTDNTRDDYRFGIFDWLAYQQDATNADAVIILGDITDKKDRHSAQLVNRIVDSLDKLRPPVYLLRGNHDGINQDTPFFRFLDGHKGISFVTKPCYIPYTSAFFLPHCTSQTQFDQACSLLNGTEQAILLHQTMDGAIAENGVRQSGLTWPKKPCVPVYSGDIHKPQTCDDVIYVGAPYHIRHGDSFSPRVLSISADWRSVKELHFPAPKKHALTISHTDDLDRCNLQQGDHVKITVELSRHEVMEWGSIKDKILKKCGVAGVIVFGINLTIPDGQVVTAGKATIKSGADIFEEFCKREKIPSTIKKIGRGFL